MMKSKLKQFLLIILSFIALWACQQDDLYNNESSSLDSKGMVKKMSLKDLNKDSEAYRILERFRPSDKKDNVLFKNIVQTDYGFSVDTDEFLYIEDNDKNSYTFRVYRDDNTNELENLVLNYNSETESYDTFLIEYLVENDDYQNILNNQEIDDFSSKTKVTFLPEFDSGSLIQARVHTSIFYDCTYSVTYVPALAGEATGIYLDYVPVYTLVDCTITNISSSGNDVPFVVGGDGEFSGGGPFNGTGPVGGSSSSHNSGNSNPTIVTVPYENIKYAKRDFFINNILSQEERDFFTDLENYEIRNLIFQYLDDSETNISAMSMITGYNNTDAVDFAKWGVGFLKDNPDVSFEDLLNNRTGFDVETGDFDNNTVGGYDNTPY